MDNTGEWPKLFLLLPRSLKSIRLTASPVRHSTSVPTSARAKQLTLGKSCSRLSYAQGVDGQVSKSLKWAILVPLIAFGVLALVVVGYVGFGIAFRTHPAPEYDIGSNFDQRVTVYVNGQKMVTISPGSHKKCYPYEVIPPAARPSTDERFSVELKSDSGVVLYSGLFTYDEALQSFDIGITHWIGGN